MARSAPGVAPARSGPEGLRAGPARPGTVSARPGTVSARHLGRPHVRLGLAWALITAGALALGSPALDVWLGVGGALAAWQAGRGWGRRQAAPQPVVAGVGALALALAALAGPWAEAGAVLALAAGTGAWQAMSRQPGPSLLPAGRGRHREAPVRGASAPVTLGLACAGAAPCVGVVLTDRHGLALVLGLLALAAAFDAGAFVVGSGASAAWEGPAAGVVAMVPLVLVMATAAAPRVVGPVALGVVAAVLAPAGARLGHWLRGDRRAPAMGRLDSLILVAPAWAVLAPWLLG